MIFVLIAVIWYLNGLLSFLFWTTIERGSIDRDDLISIVKYSVIGLYAWVMCWQAAKDKYDIFGNKKVLVRT